MEDNYIDRLTMDNYSEHNFHNETLNKWLVENHEGSSYDWDYDCYINTSPVCNCEGEEYDFFYDTYDAENLVQYIQNLTEEERQDIINLINIRVYLCPQCGAWGVDGDDGC